MSRVLDPFHKCWRALVLAGWYICATPYATKGPRIHGWQAIGHGEFQDELWGNMAKTNCNENNSGHVFGSASPAACLDWDCPESAFIGHKLFMEHIGDTPLVRQGRPGTWAAFFQIDKRYQPKNRRLGRFELFANSGFMNFGPNHPAGYQYKWLFKLPTEVPVWDLPTVTGEQLNRCIAACKEAIPPREVSKHQLPANVPRSMADRVTEYDFELINRLGEQRRDTPKHKYGEVILNQLENMGPGERHFTMVSVVSSLVSNGFADDGIFHLLSDTYIKRFAGDGTNREAKVRAAIDSARVKFGGKEPRYWETNNAA